MRSSVWYTFPPLGSFFDERDNDDMGSRRISRSPVGSSALESSLDQTHGQHSWGMSGWGRNARGVSIFRSRQQRQTVLESRFSIGEPSRRRNGRKPSGQIEGLSGIPQALASMRAVASPSPNARWIFGFPW